MELVTVEKAIEYIKQAGPGDTLSLGLYKDAATDPLYGDLKELLGYPADGTILTGPHKVFSEILSYTTAPDEYATGWIDRRAFFPDRDPYDISEITGINDVYFWPQDYNNVTQLVSMINGNDYMNVSAVHDTVTDRIVITSKRPGPRPNEGSGHDHASAMITLVEPTNKSIWDDPNFQFVSGPYLTGSTPDDFVRGIYVWIKLTEIEPEVDYDIALTVYTTADNTTVNLPSRWLWDEYTEIESENVSTINWGDGSPEVIVYSADDIAHTYNYAGQYKVYINGLHWCGNANEAVDLPIKEVHFKTSQVITQPDHMFANMSTLSKVAGELFIAKTVATTDATTYFANSPELTDTSTIKIH